MKNPQPLKGMSGGVILSKKRQIKFKRKLYEFFVAPITTFWSWTLSFALFLSTLTYVLLIRTPQKPTWLEWYLLAYIVSFGFEILRKVCNLYSFELLIISTF
jgi:transient receptor potential cation channel subfamily M protein 3